MVNKINRYLITLIIICIAYSIFITYKYINFRKSVNLYKELTGSGAGSYKVDEHPIISFSESDIDSIKIIKRLLSIYLPGFVIKDMKQNRLIDKKAIEFFNNIEPNGKLYDIVLQSKNGESIPPLRRPIAAVTHDDVFILTEDYELISFLKKYSLGNISSDFFGLCNFIANVNFDFERGKLIKSEEDIISSKHDARFGTRFIFEPKYEHVDDSIESIEFCSWNRPAIYYWKIKLINNTVENIKRKEIGYAGTHWRYGSLIHVDDTTNGKWILHQK